MTSQPFGVALALGMALMVGMVVARSRKTASMMISLGRLSVVSLPATLSLLTPQNCYSDFSPPRLLNINNGRSVTWTNLPGNPLTSDLDVEVLGVRNIFGGHNLEQLFSLNQPIGAVGLQVINNQTTLRYLVAVPPGGMFSMSFTPAWLPNTEFNVRWSFPAGDEPFAPEIFRQGEFSTDNNAVPVNIPEPSALWLFGIGALGLFIYSFGSSAKRVDDFGPF